jgi:hypothetical protein
MAGISISEGRSWFCAKWLFRYVVESCKENLPVDSPLRDAIEYSLVSDLHWFDVGSMPGGQSELLRTEVIRIYDHLKQGPDSFPSPEVYPGLMERLSDLIELLAQRPIAAKSGPFCPLASGCGPPVHEPGRQYSAPSPPDQSRSWLDKIIAASFAVLARFRGLETGGVHTRVSSGTGKVPKQGGPNSIYEQIGPEGKVTSRVFYDENGNPFGRQDFDHSHGTLEGPHEHSRQLHPQGRPVTPKVTRALPGGYDNTPTR